MAPACLQVPRPGFGFITDSSEDCLYLNIWRNANVSQSSELVPVMFWIYGGAFTAGSTDQPLYDGRNFTTLHNVIVRLCEKMGGKRRQIGGVAGGGTLVSLYLSAICICISIAVSMAIPASRTLAFYMLRHALAFSHFCHSIPHSPIIVCTRA